MLLKTIFLKNHFEELAIKNYFANVSLFFRKSHDLFFTYHIRSSIIYNTRARHDCNTTATLATQV